MSRWPAMPPCQGESRQAADHKHPLPCPARAPLVGLLLLSIVVPHQTAVVRTQQQESRATDTRPGRLPSARAQQTPTPTVKTVKTLCGS
jgi:hypothetical protein